MRQHHEHMHNQYFYSNVYTLPWINALSHEVTQCMHLRTSRHVNCNASLFKLWQKPRKGKQRASASCSVWSACAMQHTQKMGPPREWLRLAQEGDGDAVGSEVGVPGVCDVLAERLQRALKDANTTGISTRTLCASEKRTQGDPLAIRIG